MALINCPECKKEISDKAAPCPNCGYPIGPQYKQPLPASQCAPLEKKQQSFGCGTAILYVFLIGGLASIFSDFYKSFNIQGGSNNVNYKNILAEIDAKNEAAKQLSQDEKRLGERPFGEAVVSVYLKNNLKDTGSLKDLECGELYAGELAWEIECSFKAKNSFGGYVVETRKFLLRGNNVIGND